MLESMEQLSKVVLWLDSPRFRRILYVLIFLILLANGREYPAGDGFDYGGHRDYVESLYEDRALPTWRDTQNSYNPPAFYLFAAGFYWLSDHTFLGVTSPVKVIRIVLAIMACSTVWFAAQICGMLLGEKSKTLYLIWTAATPAFFKTAAMFSPESFGIFFIWMGCWIGIRSWRRDGFLNAPSAAGAAICLSVAAWTRPLHAAAAAGWAAAMIWMLIRDRERRGHWIRATLIGGAICGLAAFSLVALNYQRMGHWLGLPRGMEEWRKIREQLTEEALREVLERRRKTPLDFYVGLSLPDLFLQPVRDNLGRRLIPVFYSDWWGDYWKYWTCNEEDEELNQAAVARMLGAQNMAALPATFVLLIGIAGMIVSAFRAPPRSDLAALAPIALLALIGAGLYFHFVNGVAYGSLRFDPVKAIYVAFIAPAVAMGGVWGVRSLCARFPRFAPALAVYLLSFAAWTLFVIGFYWGDLI